MTAAQAQGPTEGRFEHPPTLSKPHVAELQKRGITEGFAIESGVRTAADNEIRKLNFQASLPVSERSKGLQGICFEYRDLAGTPVSWRIKPDTRVIMGDGAAAKYLSRIGDHVHAYYPHTTTEAHRTNTRTNVIITEGEFKSLAIAERIVPICSRPTCVIGLQGVNGGWHRDRVTVARPDGSKEVRKEGAPHLIDDLLAWEWKKRTVYIVFDSDVGSRQQAAEFQKNKRSGAWGAEYTLSLLLRGLGADVRIVVLPPALDGSKYGADDYIAAQGPQEFLKLLYNSHVVERSVEDALYREKRAAIRIMSAEDLIRSAPERPGQVIAKILPIGGLAIIGGASGVGKSHIAINACQAVATGGRMLDLLDCDIGKAIYIQTELAPWTMEDRLKGLGPISPNFLICSPGAEMPLNWWEPDGFNKRRETGGREVMMALLEQIKSHAPRLVCFDPLMDFTSNSLRDQDAAQHLMQIFRAIARVCRCGVLLIHHHRKVGGRESRYEGQDDSFGSFSIAAKVDSGMNLYRYDRSDGTCRTKLVFSKLRHAAPMEPVEIDRIAGGNSLAWRALPWDDHTRARSVEDDIVEALQDGGHSWAEMMKITGAPKTSLHRGVKKLIDSGVVTKTGNIYLISSQRNGKYDEP